MLAGLFLQVSLFVAPTFRGEAPPESRSARALVIGWEHGARDDGKANRDAAAKLAEQLAAELRGGASFDALSARARAVSSTSGGGVLGTFFPGLLTPPVDEFLFHAAELEVSKPIETDSGFQVVQRIDRLAGCRAILIASQDAPARARAQELLRRLTGGADFGETARACSDDPVTAARGGALAIFERGANDSLLKAAAFQLRLGEIAGPIESPLGLHLIQRVDPASLDPGLLDDTVARVRMILIAFEGAHGAAPELKRTHEAAAKLASELASRIRAGEDMAELAAQHDDDSGGRERRGDAGWIRRRSTQIAPTLERVFSLRVGETADPVATNAGWLVLRRER